MFALALLLSAAGLKSATIPVRSQAQADADGVLIWADTKLWRYAPSDTEAWLTVIGIDLLNTNDVPVEFRLQEVFLLDDKGRQAAPFFIPTRIGPNVSIEAMWEGVNRTPPNPDSLEQLTSGQGASSVFVTDDRRAGNQAWQFREAFGIGNIPTDWNPQQIRYVQTPRELTLRAIFNRTLAPGQRAHGYLAFPRLADDAKAAWLLWRGARVPFVVDRSR